MSENTITDEDIKFLEYTVSLQINGGGSHQAAKLNLKLAKAIKELQSMENEKK